MPATCASASVRITPGTIGLPGKCPANIASSASKTVRASVAFPGSQRIISLTKTNGGRWGSPKNGSADEESWMEDGDCFKKLSSVLHSLAWFPASSVYEIDKLPASLHSRDSNSVAIVIERRVRKLRR